MQFSDVNIIINELSHLDSCVLVAIFTNMYVYVRSIL